jgi:pimeloyl-ACP methyl ester carboxylesterase
MAPGYFETGAGETVLMLHGSLASKGQWRALGERLAERHRVIAVDLHGYGDNPMPRFRQRHTFGNEVALVLRRLRESGRCGGPMHVVGHSFGAGVALALAREAPRMVASLALYEPPCFPLLLPARSADYRTARTVGERVSRHVAEGRPDEALRAFLDYWGGAGSYEALTPDARAALTGRVAKAALDFDAVFTAPSETAAWTCIEAPVLLMRGRRSPTEVRRAIEALARLLPLARLEEMAGDHLMPLRDPQPVNDAVVRFLDTLRWIEASRPAAHAGVSRPSPASWATTMA